MNQDGEARRALVEQMKQIALKINMDIQLRQQVNPTVLAAGVVSLIQYDVMLEKELKKVREEVSLAVSFAMDKDKKKPVTDSPLDNTVIPFNNVLGEPTSSDEGVGEDDESETSGE